VTPEASRSPSTFLCGHGQCTTRLDKPLLRLGRRSEVITCPACRSKHAFYVSRNGKNEAHYFLGPNGESSGWGYGPASQELDTVGRLFQSGPIRRVTPRSGWRTHLPRWRPRSWLGMAIVNRLSEWCSFLAHRVLRRSRDPFSRSSSEEMRRPTPSYGNWPSNN